MDFFGLLKTDGDREKVMEEIDRRRAKAVYQHLPEDCSEACKERGEEYFVYFHQILIQLNDHTYK